MGEPGPPCALGDRERSGDGPDAPIEGELTDGRVVGEPFGRKLAGGREHRERDREVESGALLPERCRCEIDRDPPVERPLERRRDHAASNPVLRFLARPVGQSDDREPGYPGLEVRLYLDAARLEADEGMSDRTREHPLDDRRGGVT